MERGYIQIYTGEGKGKTTAAFGLAFRALGNGLRVMIVQFLKGRQTGELKIAEQFDPQLSFYRAAESNKFSWNLTLPEKRELQQKVVREINDIIEGLECGLWDVLILDEIMGAMSAEIVKESDVLRIIEKRPESVELVMTGRNVPEAIKEKADLITEMCCVKHYYQKDVKARKGIEF